jgi:hypothetical protein
LDFKKLGECFIEDLKEVGALSKEIKKAVSAMMKREIDNIFFIFSYFNKVKM